MSTIESPARPRVGPLLRDWRRRRRMSQLDLALDSGVSARHLSFIETGRARPSAEMILRLSDHLDVPLRARNDLLLAAGHAPVFEERQLDSPELGPVHHAVQAILRGHEPYPAAAVDRRWELLAGNAGIAMLVAGVAPDLLAPPANVLRISLHPDGMAPRIANLGEWRAHLLERLARRSRTRATRSSPPCTTSCSAIRAAKTTSSRATGRRSPCRCGCAPTTASSPSSRR